MSVLICMESSIRQQFLSDSGNLLISINTFDKNPVLTSILDIQLRIELGLGKDSLVL